MRKGCERVIKNYKFSNTSKVGGQEYESCERVGLESMKRQLCHATGLGQGCNPIMQNMCSGMA